MRFCSFVAFACAVATATWWNDYAHAGYLMALAIFYEQWAVRDDAHR